jgi:homocitrate synthase
MSNSARKVQRIEIMDTTFRDGQQSPLWYDTQTNVPSLEEKLNLLEGILKLGVKHLEFFSPIVGTKEAEEFVEVKKYIQAQAPNVILHAHCRCNEKDIQLALDAGFTALNLYFGTSKESIKGNHNKSIADIKTISLKIITDLRKTYPSMWLRFSGEDAFRTDIETLCAVYSPLENLVDAFGTPDTVGVATPALVGERILMLRKAYPKVELECHFHNDRGFSTINALTAVQAGAKYIDCSVWGIAERSGITSTTALLLNLYEEDPAYVQGYDLSMSYPVNVILGSIFRMQIPTTEPVSLTNRTHIAGVHQNAVTKDAAVYEAHSLEKFGVGQRDLILNHLSGYNTIYYYLKEVENFQLSKEEAREISEEFKNRTREVTKTKDARELLLDIAASRNLRKTVLPQNMQKRRLENL